MKGTTWVLGLSILLGLARGAIAEPALATPAPWSAPSGRGLAVGVDNGLWGAAYASGVRVRVPVGERWALVPRVVAAHGLAMEPLAAAPP